MFRESGPIDYYDKLSDKDKKIFDMVLEEARSKLPQVGDITTYLHTSGGLLRLSRHRDTGEVYITGATARDGENLLEMQNYVARKLNIKIY